jgi:hypothetical protein
LYYIDPSLKLRLNEFIGIRVSRFHIVPPYLETQGHPYLEKIIESTMYESSELQRDCQELQENDEMK